MSDLSAFIRRFQNRTAEDSRGDHVVVVCDEECICVHNIKADGHAPVTTRCAWESILRVCFKDNGPMASDLIYLFVAGNTRPLAIPLESDGAGILWRELRARGIFPKTLHERATLSTDGRLYCWPPVRVNGRMEG